MIADFAAFMNLAGYPDAERGTPRTAEDLAHHDFITLPPWHHRGDVLTAPDGRRHRVAVKRKVTSNNQLTIKQLALAGCGLSFHVLPEISDELAAGRLVRVLPQWALPRLSVDALLPPRTKQPAKVRAALDALSTYLTRPVSAAAKARQRRAHRTPSTRQ